MRTAVSNPTLPLLGRTQLSQFARRRRMTGMGQPFAFSGPGSNGGSAPKADLYAITGHHLGCPDSGPSRNHRNVRSKVIFTTVGLEG
jgi:hypothetical protein